MVSVLTVEQGVSRKMEDEVVELLKRAGATDVKLDTYVPFDRKRQAVDKIESRLRGSEGPLKVYLSPRGVWIKGVKLPARINKPRAAGPALPRIRKEISWRRKEMAWLMR